jgi:hypothetical protein
MDLNFTARKIDSLERESGESFLMLMTRMTMRSLAFFVSAGTDVTLDEAFGKIENYIKPEAKGGEGKDLVSLQMLITRKLQDDGFLPREINLDEIQKTQTDLISNPTPASPLEMLGEVEKKQQ